MSLRSTAPVSTRNIFRPILPAPPVERHSEIKGYLDVSATFSGIFRRIAIKMRTRTRGAPELPAPRLLSIKTRFGATLAARRGRVDPTSSGNVVDRDSSCDKPRRAFDSDGNGQSGVTFYSPRRLAGAIRPADCPAWSSETSRIQYLPLPRDALG